MTLELVCMHDSNVEESIAFKATDYHFQINFGVIGQ